MTRRRFGAGSSSLEPATADQIAARVPLGFAATEDARARTPGRSILRIAGVQLPVTAQTVMQVATVEHAGWAQFALTLEANSSTGACELMLVQSFDATFSDRVRVFAHEVPDLTAAPRFTFTQPRIWLPEGMRYRLQVRTYAWVPGATVATLDGWGTSLPDTIAGPE